MFRGQVVVHRQLIAINQVKTSCIPMSRQVCFSFACDSKKYMYILPTECQTALYSLLKHMKKMGFHYILTEHTVCLLLHQILLLLQQ